MSKTTINKVYLQAGLGIRVSRAAAADPQAVFQTIFTISGGNILLTSLVGIRTVVQAGGASTMQFRHSIGPTVLDAGTLSVAGQAPLTIYVLTGDPANAIIAGAAGAPVVMGKVTASATTGGEYGCGVVMGAGNIQVTMTAAAGTGSTRYMMTYIPLDDAANVVAA